VEIAEHIDALREQGEALADAAARTGLDAPVPLCAPWRVMDLLRHTGYIHRWSASHIAQPRDHILDGLTEDEILRGGAPDGELLDWFRAGHAALVRTLEAADPELRTATFMAAPSPLAFWARRQAHETAIHRADADSATGGLPGYPADFAADGVDELIMGFGGRRKYQPEAGHAGVLGVLATDTGDAWHVRIEDGRGYPAHEQAVADCVIRGSASDLYLFLWNRAEADIDLSGDPAVLALWKSGVRVRWG
jgi:uncharacterized protein (TIGR03083 family)